MNVHDYPDSMSERYALILRGPNGVGKSQTTEAVLRAWTDTSHVVLLDHGWGGDPAVDWRRTSQGRERYRDLVDDAATKAALLVVEVGTAEPDDGDTHATGATRDPREWIDLLADRKLLLFRLSASWPRLEEKLIDRKKRKKEPAIIHFNERRHHARIEFDEWKIRFHAKARLVEHTINLDTMSFDDAAEIILAHRAVAGTSPPGGEGRR